MNKNRMAVIGFFYFLFAVTALMINSGNNRVSSVSYIILILVSTICRVETNIVILFCLLPFQRIFLLNESFMTLIPIIQVLVLCKCFLNGKIRARSNIQLVFCVFLALYSACNELFRFSTISNTLQYTLTILTMILICDIVDSRLRRDCFIGFCISALLSAIVGYFYPSVSRFTALYTSQYIVRFQGLMGDPGEFGQTMVCAIAVSIALIFTGRQYLMNKHISRNSVIFVITFCVVSFSFILMSGTRACLIAIAVVYAAILYWMFRTKNKTFQVIGIICFVFSIFVISTVGSYLFDLLSISHGGEALADDNRFSIWQGYLTTVFNHLDVVVFGVGMDSCNSYGQMVGLGNPHNIFIEKMVECGIIGLSLNFGIFYPIFKRKNMRFLNPSTLPFYVFGSTLLVYGSAGIILPYMLLALISEEGKGEEDENQKIISYAEKQSHRINRSG